MILLTICVCHVYIINSNSTFSFIILLQMPKIPATSNTLTDHDIEQIVADKCRFIQHEICHESCEFYDPESALAADECIKLRTMPQSLMWRQGG